MSFNIFRENGQNMQVDSPIQGAQVLTPYVYFGNAQARNLLFGAQGDTAESAAFNTSTNNDDEQAPVSYSIGSPPTSSYPSPFTDGEQCLKRFQIEVNKVKANSSQDDDPLMLVPSPYEPQRNLEYDMWGKKANQRVKDNFLLKFDTIDLYCGAQEEGDLTELGRVGTSAQFGEGAFPARGLPIRFQKVYFYGTRGGISGSADITADKAFNERTQSDGRGALFSTYILCANAAVNSLDPAGGRAQLGYNSNELSSYNLPGGTFTYLGDDNNNTDSSTDFYLGGNAEYDKGIDVEWPREGYGTDAPLIIGDGALGFREQSIGKDIFGEVDIYEVTAANKYYVQEVTLCIDGYDKTGKILWQPDDLSSVSESDARVIAHDIRNTFSCSSIMPSIDCTGCGENYKECWPDGQGGPLDYQNEKVYIFKDTTMLMRSDPAGIDSAEAAYGAGPCECE